MPAGLSEAEIRLQLAEEDDQAAEDGEVALHDVTPAAMLLELLDIEDLQYVLLLETSSLRLTCTLSNRRRFKQKFPKASSTSATSSTAHQNTEMIHKRTVLRRRLNNVRLIQAIYMPCVPQLLARHLRAQTNASVVAAHAAATSHSANAATAATTAVSTIPGPSTPAAEDDQFDLPESQPLFLPHALECIELDMCTPGLAENEERLRDAQLSDSLDKLRVQLHVKTRLVNFKNRHVRHQRPNTRARRKIGVNEGKIVTIAEKYRAAHQAKLRLAGPGDWENTWRVLRRTDVRTLTEDELPESLSDLAPFGELEPPTASSEDDPKRSEGRRQTSWIWMAADTENANGNLQKGMQDGEHCLRTKRGLTDCELYSPSS